MVQEQTRLKRCGQFRCKENHVYPCPWAAREKDTALLVTLSLCQ